MEPVRMGLVGYGFGGRYFHAPLLASAAECAFLGVVTTSAQRREQVGREHPGAATFGSLRELRDAGAEAVAISTPADTHTALTDEALELGLAVVCDKPFALAADPAPAAAGVGRARALVSAKPFPRDAGAARAWAERAERLGLPLAPYQNRRWDSDF